MTRKCYWIVVVEGQTINHYFRKARNEQEAIKIGENKGIAATVEVTEISLDDYNNNR